MGLCWHCCFFSGIASSIIQQMFSIWSLAPLPSLNPAWRPGNSWFTECWSLACKILSITLLAWEMSLATWWLAHSLVLHFLGTGMRIDLFQSCGDCWVQICWHNECKTLMASSFRNLNSSAEISSHPLDLLTAVLLKAHLALQNVWLWGTNYTIIVIRFIKIFFIQFFHVFFPFLLDLFSIC